MFRGWKNVVEKLVKGPRDFQRGGGVEDGRQRKGTEGYGYLPQNALSLRLKRSGTKLATAPFGLRSLSAGVFGGFFRTIYMSCRAPLCCCVLSRSGGSSIDCVSLFLIRGAFLAMMSERYYVIAQNRPNHLLMRS